MSGLLPHEVHMLSGAQEGIRADLTRLAKEKAEAQGSSYDWHDNAPLDAVENELERVRSKGRVVAQLIANAEIVDYPPPNEAAATLGSLVLAEDRWGEAPFIIVGQRLVGIDEYKSRWVEDFGGDPDDFNVVTPDSILGKHAVGIKAGDTIEYRVDENRDAKYTVASVDQKWVVETFGAQAASLQDSARQVTA